MKEIPCQLRPVRMESRSLMAFRVTRGASRINACTPSPPSLMRLELSLAKAHPVLCRHSVASGFHQALRRYFSFGFHSASQKQTHRWLEVRDAQGWTSSRGQNSKSKTQQHLSTSSECMDWWAEKMEQTKKPATRDLLKRLSYSNLLGLNEKLKNGSFREGTLNSELMEVKARYPREVLLCRVGEFYEAVGFDACILVEYASLNPMSGLRSDTVPRAGCPVMNLRQTLDAVTSSGFSVCVYEEIKGPSQGRQRKDRFISGHAHPGSPYVYGLAEANIDLDVSEEVFVVGISKSVRGYCLIFVSEMMRTFSVEDGLTEEAAVAKLRARICFYFFLHRSLRDDSSGLASWREYGEGGLLWAECQGKSCEWYDHDPVSQVISKVKNLYDLDSMEEFREVIFQSKGRPRPLYVGTATQIGIIPTPGVPSLLKVLLPRESTHLCRAYMRDLLLNPPPPQIASSIQAACKLMTNVTTAIPEFASVPAAKLVKLISSKEANYLEFSRIRNLAEDILSMHKDQQLSVILECLLDPTSLTTGLNTDRQPLINDCIHLIAQLNNVLATEEDPEQKFSSLGPIPDDFFQFMECSWKGRVRRALVDSFYEEVQKAAEHLKTTVENDFSPILMHVRASDTFVTGVLKAEIVFSRDNDAVWLKLRNFPATNLKMFKELLPAIDAKGKRAKDDLYSTAAVELALERYRNAVLNASCRVYEVLRTLAEDLKGSLNTIVFISVLAVIAKSLFAHVSEGRRRGWNFPELLNDDTQMSMNPYEKSSRTLNGGLADISSKRDELVFHDLIPYWVDKAHSSVVSNSVMMRSLHLLTGPNGGGKSSILRSIGAATLLGICGLMVPVASAMIPRFDAVMLRMMPQDSPADEKSSFQMEMSELHTILGEVTSRSLVLVDELCRGTEVQKGTALAASIIEFLDSTGCVGVLSTHLHGLLDMKLNVKNVIYKAMGTAMVDGVLKPTWKMEDGCCRESLAFETARREGVPESVLQRAAQLYAMNYVSQEEALQTKGLVYQEFLAFDKGQGNLKEVRENNHVELIKYSNLASRSSELSTSELLQGPVISKQDVSEGLNMKAVNNAALLFKDICKRKIMEMQRGNSKHTSEDILEINDIFFTLVRERELPPPGATSRSCVYLIFRPDGKFYIGQTDNISGRIKAHRGKPGLQKAPFLYVQVPSKSSASELETFLINQLTYHGVALVNKCDQHHRHFGTRTDVPSQLPF